jgi:hypothetical protein
MIVGAAASSSFLPPVVMMEDFFLQYYQSRYDIRYNNITMRGIINSMDAFYV